MRRHTGQKRSERRETESVHERDRVSKQRCEIQGEVLEFSEDDK